VLGLPLYDVSRLVPALESLLAQTYRDFALVICDDGAPEAGRAAVAPYLSDHLSYDHNAARLGLTANWRRTFARARELHGPFEYFAWASDHDLWTPDWLGLLVDALDSTAEAVLAWPTTVAVDDAGRELETTRAFDTAGRQSRRARFAAVVSCVPAGDMVYGLLRADALERCGVFPDVLLPDRLLLSELSLLGTFRHVPEAVWHRRRRHDGDTRERQLVSFWPEGPPRMAERPWPLQHALAFARTMRPLLGAVRAALYGAYLFVLAGIYYVRSRP
jgi:glycosyltransferase involved in cell wall biosynthesis